MTQTDQNLDDPADYFPTLEVPNGGLILGSGGLPFPVLLVPQGWHAERDRTRPLSELRAGPVNGGGQSG